jgi:sugar phosphate isomerase/epimerase
MCAAMRDRDVSISLGEGISVRPSREISDSARDMDIMKELGVGRINAVSLDPDRNRTFDQLGLLADMAESREMRVTLEFVPGLVIGDLPQAVAAVQHVGRAHVAVLIDTMHLVRSGSGAAELAALDPALIGYVQMCDVLLIPLIENYGEEAMFERMVPGEGELPLCDIMGALPDDAIVGLEVPLRAAAEAGEDTRSRVQRCVQGARTVLGRAG